MEKISINELLEENPVENFPEVESLDDVMFQLSRFHNRKSDLSDRIKDLNQELEEVENDFAYAEKAFEYYADLLESYRKGSQA